MYQLAWKDRPAWLQSEPLDLPVAPADRPVAGVALLHWEEHCVECAAPECFSSCGLYQPRTDTACARFDYGIYPNPRVSGAFAFGADVQFRRWAKLEASWPTAPQLYPVSKLRRLARALSWVERGLASRTLIPGFGAVATSLNDRADRLQTALRSGFSENDRADADVPDALYVKFYSPSHAEHRLNLEILHDRPLWRQSLAVTPGWNEQWIPLDPKLFAAGGEKRLIRLWPDRDEAIRLVFTWLDCVRFEKEQIARTIREPAPQVKCVAWDLDDTLWSGIIGDVGPRHVHERQEMLDLIRRLDERGVLQTVASKNEHTLAWQKIVELGLEEMFLFPAIHWGPKSESLKQIAERLNIGLDSFLLIDDSDFERREVSDALPEVRVCDPVEVEDLLDRPEFQFAVTEESRNRRKKYLEQSLRDRVLQSWRGDYDAFLRSCEMRLRLGDPHGARGERCLELLRRSNQFNLSGERYSAADLRAIRESDSRECVAFEVEDRYGSYGTVGFAAIEVEEATYTFDQFVMSCRVAGKRVEETLILWLAERARQRGFETLAMRLRDTGRNRPLQTSLEALAFRSRQVGDDEILLELDLSREISVPTVIEVVE